MSIEIKEADELNFSSLIKLIKIRKKLIIIFMLVSLFAVTIYSFIMPHEYEAVATLQPPSKSKGAGGLSSFLQSFAGSGGLVLGGMGQTNESQMFSEILKSRAVAEFIVNEFDLKNNPYFKTGSELQLQELIRTMLDTELERSGMLTITSNVRTGYFASSEEKDDIAELSSKFANAAVNGLDYIIRQKNISTARRTRIYIEGELIEYKRKLDSVELELEKFQNENKVLDLVAQTSAILGQTVQLGTELNKAEVDLNLAKQQYQDKSPTVIAYRNIVNFLRQQYHKAQSGGLTNEDDFSIPLKDMPRLLRIFTDLAREQKILEQVILYLETQRHQEAIQEERDIPIVEVLDKAVTPEFKASPNRKLMLILSFFISFIVIFSIVVLNALVKGTLYIKRESVK